MTVDWGRYNLPAIWTMLKNENVCDGADRVLSWDTLSQDVDEQHKRLVAAQKKLAEVWPPDKNVSAQVFLLQVAGLADSMGETLKAAQETRAGLQGILDAIATAQSTLSPLVQARQAASGDLIPRFVDGAEDDFDRAGQKAMQLAEAAILDHGSQIEAPPLFSMQPGSDDTSRDLPEPGREPPGPTGATGGSLAAVPVPVPVPHGPPDFGKGARSDGLVSADGTGQVVGKIDDGLGLAGVLPLSPATPAGLGSSLPGSTTAPLAGGIPGLGLPGAVIGGGAFGAGVAGGSDGFLGGPGPGRRAGSAGFREPVPIRRGLPSGATIGGGEPEGGLGSRGGAGQGSLVGQSPGGGMLPGQTGGRGRGGSTASDGNPGVNSDLLWGIRSGVAPVIEPDTSPVRHDPGPGIIGLNA